MMPTIADEHEALIQFLHLAPVGLVKTAIDGEIVMINPISAQLLLPLVPDGCLDNLFTALESVAPELRHLIADFAYPYGKVCDALHIQLNAGVHGKADPQILSLSLLKLDENRLMGVLSDVTLQVKRDRLLRQSEAWFNAILTGITDYALVSLDRLGRVDDWNASLGRVTGFERAAVLGRPYSIFYPADATTPDRILDRLTEADQNGWSLDDGWRMRADGSQFWGSAMIAPLRDRQHPLGGGVALRETEEDRAYCLIIRDISDKRDASESQRRATSCDHLTKLANRSAFFEAAELEIARWKRSPRELSLVLFDADDFKRINDKHGHPAGDAVLRNLATLLTATFRQVDVVARVGGEEFAVLLPSSSLGGAAQVANRLRHAVESQAVEVDGVSIRYTVSAGVATMAPGMAGLDALMKRADEALCVAKAAGRNRVDCWSAS